MPIPTEHGRHLLLDGGKIPVVALGHVRELQASRLIPGVSASAVVVSPNFRAVVDQPVRRDCMGAAGRGQGQGLSELALLVGGQAPVVEVPAVRAGRCPGECSPGSAIAVSLSVSVVSVIQSSSPRLRLAGFMIQCSFILVVSDGNRSEPDQVDQADGLRLAAGYADAHTLQIGAGDLGGAQRTSRVQRSNEALGLEEPVQASRYRALRSRLGIRR